MAWKHGINTVLRIVAEMTSQNKCWIVGTLKEYASMSGFDLAWRRQAHLAYTCISTVWRTDRVARHVLTRMRKTMFHSLVLITGNSAHHLAATGTSLQSVSILRLNT
jgi:hypothetical protein